MKAHPEQQQRLLDLQAIDTRLAQLAHSRKTLPVLAELADLSSKAQLIDEQIVRAATAVDDVKREVAKADADVQQVRDRAAKDAQRLEAGVGTSKDLMALQHEIESLARRQGELEEVELEVMERAEALESDHTNLLEGRAKLTERMQALEADRDAAFAQIDAEHEQVSAGRADVAADAGIELVDLYTKITATSGTGAAMLRQRRCGGCQLELNAIEMDRIRSAPADEVLRCEECRRILVRTPESGL